MRQKNDENNKTGGDQSTDRPTMSLSWWSFRAKLSTSSLFGGFSEAAGTALSFPYATDDDNIQNYDENKDIVFAF